MQVIHGITLIDEALQDQYNRHQREQDMVVNDAKVALEIKASMEKKLADFMVSSEKKLANTMEELKTFKDSIWSKDEELMELKAKLKKNNKSNHSLKWSIKEEKEKAEEAIKNFKDAKEAKEEAMRKVRSVKEVVRSVEE